MGYGLDNKLGEKIRKRTEEMKDKIVQDYNKTKKRKDPELVRDNIKVRLPEKYLIKLLKHELMTSQACQNKGFVLDGFPKTY